MDKQTLLEKEKRLFTSTFSFSHNVFKGFFLGVVKTQNCELLHKSNTLTKKMEEETVSLGIYGSKISLLCGPFNIPYV